MLKQANGSIDLGVELTNHTGEEDHGETGDKEDINDDLWHAPERGVGDWSSAQVDGENNEYNHKLTSDEVTVEVVSLVADHGVIGGSPCTIHGRLGQVANCGVCICNRCSTSVLILRSQYKYPIRYLELLSTSIPCTPNSVRVPSSQLWLGLQAARLGWARYK